MIISGCTPLVTLLKKTKNLTPTEIDVGDPSILRVKDIPKYVSQLIIPPAMPQSPSPDADMDYYEIAVRQFNQQVLPEGFPATTVWSYGPANYPESFNFPAYTVEAKYNRPVRIKWINDLVDENGNFLPHLLPVDQTLHWANPTGGNSERDAHGRMQTSYTGPVPIVTHVHGAHVTQESDGYPEAWYLPAAKNLPAGVALNGTWYDKYKQEFTEKYGADWEPGSCIYQYPNQQRAATLWYHDHTLGMTRLNVYAGPAGFYIIRGGKDDQVAGLPGPAPAMGDIPDTQYYEIPLAIQDRTFKKDGTFFYPANRAYFEEMAPEKLKIPFYPDTVKYPDGSTTGDSDIAPIWNPEYFGNAMLVNGRTWPKLDVEARRYRFRVLNGCNSRFIILKLVQGEPAARPAEAILPFWQIGSEGGFLPKVVKRDLLLLAPAERADVIVDFTNIPAGTELYLINEGPDEPYSGGAPGDDFDPAKPEGTGQVMKFVVGKSVGTDESLPPEQLSLPAIQPLDPPTKTRQVSLNEAMSMTVFVKEDGDGGVQTDRGGEPFGPSAGFLGTVGPDGSGNMLMFNSDVTENPMQNEVEVWEINNFTMDGHPIHIHQVMFQVVDRQPKGGNEPPRSPEAWETGWKDTVIAYPREITRLRMKFDTAGRYVWHCHILEHEDNEMMRPLDVLPEK
jgi:bilirubin oxidase